MTSSPLIMVIFGATGDLMHRKLMPALYHLVKKGEISQDLYIVGVGRREITREQFHDLMASSIQENVPAEIEITLWEHLIKRMHYVQGTFEDQELYTRLTTLLSQFDEETHACVPRFFYMATPPQNYEAIITHLGHSKLSEGCGQGTSLHTRVLIEKPFGKDLDTARKLDLLLASTFEERQIYRIDHYLGKETVQNILSFRFANGIFEPTWNADFIDHVQITLAETVGVGTRGEFYDGIGALRDVVQNHMLEMLCVVAMDQPYAFDAQSIRDERVKIMQSIAHIEPSDVSKYIVRGQYAGYTAEPDVSPESKTETFVAMKIMLKNQRWRGVPFYLRTGKMMKEKATEISIHFKKPVVCTGDVCLFPEKDVRRNVLTIRIEPDERIVLNLMAKKPGYGMNLAPVTMEFSYKEVFKADVQPAAYERLFLDCIRGDQTLFARTDGIESSWAFVSKIMDAWRNGTVPMYTYERGSFGPAESTALLQNDARHWFLE